MEARQIRIFEARSKICASKRALTMEPEALTTPPARRMNSVVEALKSLACLSIGLASARSRLPVSFAKVDATPRFCNSPTSRSCNSGS